MNYREKIRKAIECPQLNNVVRYGEWGALNLEQRKYIKRLLDEVDSVDDYYKRVYLENKELKKQLHEASLTIQEMTEQDIECPSNCEKLRQLKKQFEECQLQNFDLREDIMIQKQAIPNKLIKDKSFYDLYDMPTYEDLLTRQKEFINYLEDYINLFDKKDIYEEGSCDMLEEILQKYKSIIGDDK